MLHNSSTNGKYLFLVWITLKNVKILCFQNYEELVEKNNNQA